MCKMIFLLVQVLLKKKKKTFKQKNCTSKMQKFFSPLEKGLPRVLNEVTELSSFVRHRKKKFKLHTQFHSSPHTRPFNSCTNPKHRMQATTEALDENELIFLPCDPNKAPKGHGCMWRINTTSKVRKKNSTIKIKKIPSSLNSRAYRRESALTNRDSRHDEEAPHSYDSRARTHTHTHARTH